MDSVYVSLAQGEWQDCGDKQLSQIVEQYPFVNFFKNCNV